MGLLFKGDRPKKQNSGVTEQLQRRLSRVSTPDLAPWAETCTFEIGRCLVALGRDATEVQVLDDAVLAAETLTGILDEMKRRYQG